MSEYAFLFGPADVSYDMKDYRRLYKKNKFVKRRFDEISQLTNISIEVLLKEKEEESKYTLFQRTSFGLFAGMLGVSEYVCSLEGKLPKISGGISLGDLNSVCLSEAIRFEEAVNILKNRVDEPMYQNKEEAIAFAYVSEDMDYQYYDRFDNMKISVHYDIIDENRGRILMISGLRSILETKGNEGPIGINILPSEMCKSAFHTDFRKRIAIKNKKYLESINVIDSKFMLASSILSKKIISKKNEIIENIINTETQTLYLKNIVNNIEETGVDKIYCIGPFLRDIKINFSSDIDIIYYDKNNMI